MFRWLRKRRAIRAYRTELGTSLRARHGRKAHYTPEEVKGQLRAGRMSDEFRCYALAMYCDWRTFDAYHHAEGVSRNYWGMHNEAGCAGVWR